MTDLYKQLGLPDVLRATAEPLDELGVEELAWPRLSALEVVARLRGSGIAVLGGDVLEKGPDGLHYTYSNWHLEPRSDESFEVFAERSHESARAYIQKHPAGSAESYYVLVLSVGPLPPAT